MIGSACSNRKKNKGVNFHTFESSSFSLILSFFCLSLSFIIARFGCGCRWRWCKQTNQTHTIHIWIHPQGHTKSCHYMKSVVRNQPIIQQEASVQKKCNFFRAFLLSNVIGVRLQQSEKWAENMIIIRMENSL